LLDTTYDHSTILNSIYNIENIIFLKNRDNYYATVNNTILQLEQKTKKRK
jgi:hypothetical protein